MERKFGRRGEVAAIDLGHRRTRPARPVAAPRAKARVLNPVVVLAVVTFFGAMAALWMSREPIGETVTASIALTDQRSRPRGEPRSGVSSVRNEKRGPAPAAHGVCARNCVTDGDTFRLDGEKVRIVGIDAPELRGRCREETALANKAKSRLQHLIEGKTVSIDRQGTDRFGRTLAAVRAGGRDVGQQLVNEGLARPWTGRKERWCRA